MDFIKLFFEKKRGGKIMSGEKSKLILTRGSELNWQVRITIYSSSET